MLKNRSNPDKNIPVAIFIIGILFFIGGTIIAFLYQYQFVPISDDSIQAPLYKKLLSFSPVFVLLFPIVIAPIMEEFIFRFWVKNKNYAYYITLVGIILFSYLIFKDLKITLSVLLFLIATLFVKNNKIKIWITALLTSLLFGFLHVKNYSVPAFTLIASIQLFGFGMIVSYIGLQFKFIYCIVIHAIYNLIAILPILMSSNSDSVFLNGKSFNANIKKVSIFTLLNKPTIIKDDTISIMAIPMEIAAKLNNFNKDTIYDYRINEQLEKKYLLATSKSNVQIDKKELLDSVIKQFNIRSEILLLPAYMLSVIDSSKLNKIFLKNHYYLTTLPSLVESIRSRCDVPLILNSHFDDLTLKMDYSFIRLKTIENISRFLLEEYGILITQTNDEKVVIIKYFQE